MRLRSRMENNFARCVTAACVLMAAYGPAAHGAHVLAVETVLAKSHWHFMKGVLLALVDRGHRVTVYTPFPDASSVTDNYTEVDTAAHFDAGLMAVNMDGTVVVPLFRRLSFLLPFMVRGSRTMCDVMDRVLAADRGTYDGRHAYDLFVTEPLSSECVSHVARRLAVPLVYTVPAPLLPWTETAAFGHYANPAYASHLFAEWPVPDTFYRRAYNAGLYLYTVYLHRRATYAAAAAEPRHYDVAPPLIPSLVFVNTHYVTEPSRPVPANRVDVGGIHLKMSAPLPADILQFIEDSPHGVILFSLGTVIAFSSLPDHIQRELKDALAEIPQRVLVKYEGEMKDRPKNVMTRKWLPQRDILLHPNVKLFIGHGGISGVYEAVDAGVPVIGFPMFYDQPRNVRNLVSAGMAISMDLFSITKGAFLRAINDMVNNNETSYWKNAKIVSERFKDRPMSPAESVVYWTEYVIRHNGAPHLKSQAHDLTWYQYFLLDVIATALSVILLAIYVTYKAFKCVVKKIVFKSFSKSKTE